jgi:hypothetical protein
MLGGQADKRPPRDRYLETIGFRWLDVFDTPVAELELRRSAEQMNAADAVAAARPPYFYDFFVSPPLSVGSLPIDDPRAVLRRADTAFVYGRPGDGKTMLRLALEADCRRSAERVLVASYVLEEDFRQAPTPAEHRQRLAQAMAIDLVVQIIERFNPLDPPPNDVQITALAKQLVIGGLPVQNLVKRVLDQPEPASVYGLSAHWSMVRRPIIRRVMASEALLTLLRQARQKMIEVAVAEDPLSDSLTALQAWAFERGLVLVDGVDTNTTRSPEFMLALLQPLLDELPAFEKHRVWFKFFLPLELANQLTNYPNSFIMGKWQPADFQHLLAARFRAAGSRRVRWDDLAADDLPGSLDQALVKAANGSPRRYLHLIHALIDAHALRDPLDRFISLDDWSRMRTDWTHEPPPPPRFEAL